MTSKIVSSFLAKNVCLLYISMDIVTVNFKATTRTGYNALTRGQATAHSHEDRLQRTHPRTCYIALTRGQATAHSHEDRLQRTRTRTGYNALARG